MLQKLRRTKIIATLGPSTDQNNNLEKIIIAGADIVRLNFSHGDPQEHLARAIKIREIAHRLHKHIAILGDLQGPKIRISTFQNNEIYLHKGDDCIITTETIPNNQNNCAYVQIHHKKFTQDTSPGDLLLLDDGKIRLKVLTIQNTYVHTKVISGGRLLNNKGINKLGGGLSAKIFTNKDQSDIITATKIAVDYLAISFPKNSQDLYYARKLIIDSGSNAKIISKLERAEVVQSNASIDDIIQASDAVMIARGDLGIEIGISKLVGIQKKIIQRAHMLNKPVITATQMMESMTINSTPTRSEVMDVANAVLDGTDAVMLSAETAIGKYPSETITTMANICLEAEKIANNNLDLNNQASQPINNIKEAIAKSTMYIANHLKQISAVVSIAESEHITLLMSRINSKLPIFTLSHHYNILNTVVLYKGVIPIFFDQKYKNVAFHTNRKASHLLCNKGLLMPGELIIVIQENINNAENNQYNTTNLNSILTVE